MRSSPARLFLSFLLFFPVVAFGQTYTATLLGSNETTNCDPDGTGSATVVFNGNQVTYTINVANVVLPPTMQHIHIGAAGTNGGIVIDFNNGAWVGGTLNGTVTGDPTVIAAIHANPAGYYVNVHNTPCPGGVVRGQLVFASAATSIPTFSTGILLLLAGVLAVAGLLVLRR
ncbi:MAG TPA: CHRD domain-containing protein [Thermoanaerobaculia bacterium]|nr:CHRD domain-containing protein [Thermoanaerobaculia bacterium]